MSMLRLALLLLLLSDLLFVLSAVSNAQVYSWVTIAGRGGNSDDGTNAAARFGSLWGIAVDGQTNIYVVDQGNLTIRKVTPIGTNWVSTTIAGSVGMAGSADGTNTDARFGRLPGEVWNGPHGIAVDTSGNVYVADSYNSVIREITPIGTNWVTTTIAGMAGNYGNIDGTNSGARFGYPAAIAVDPAGNLYVADPGDGIVPSAKEIDTIRKITPSGTNWVTTTIGGLAGVAGFADGPIGVSTFGVPYGIAADGQGNVFVADTGDGIVRELTQVGGGWVTTTIAGNVRSQGKADGINNTIQFQNPFGIAVDGAENVYVADTFSGTIRKLTPIAATPTGANWVSSTIASGISTYAIAANSIGDVFLPQGGQVTMLSFQGTNSFQVSLAGGNGGNIGSTDGVGYYARFYQPEGVGVDREGNVFVADTYNETIRKLTHTEGTWVSSTIAGSAENARSDDGTNSAVRFSGPYSVATASSGTLFVADTWNSVIRTLVPNGTNWISGTIGLAGISGSADGTNTEIQFQYPKGITTDDGDTIYVADTDNDIIRKLTRDGTNWVSSRIAGLPMSAGFDEGSNSNARFSAPMGIALDHDGNLYVADEGNFIIRKLTPAGTNWTVTTIAGLAGSPGGVDGTNNDARFGGPIPHAQLPDEFVGPQGLTLDNDGNIYVADPMNSAIRKISRSGTNWVTTTIGAGLGSTDGVGTNAEFALPSGVAVDAFGSVYVADTSNNSIRQGFPTPFLKSAIQSDGAIRLNWVAGIGRAFQLQYSSNLTSINNWIPLGTIVKSTNGIISASEPRKDGQGFYRAVMLP